MAAKKRKKRSKKPGLLWRGLFGHNGPTRGEWRKLLKLTFGKTFDIEVRDAVTGRVRKQRMRIGDDGKVQQVKAPAKKRKPAAKKKTSARGASQPSKPSRTSKAGSTPRPRKATAATPAPRRVRAEPLAERVLRNPDGTLAGSRPIVTEATVRREYAKALRNAAAASKHAEELLGWRQPPR